MREDLLEELEKQYPNGYIFFYLDHGGGVRLSGDKLDKHSFLTAFYHLGLALSCIMKEHKEG